ncbi:MAG: nuclease [Longimicrobiales bacterium]
MLRPITPCSANNLRAAVRERGENRPGVYRMIGPADEVLYVGKSIRLRSRLLSYFRADRGEKAAEIIGHTHSIEWDYTPSEFASLLLEMRAIRRWRPRYNVEHKRERVYCFVKLTREAAARLLVVHDADEDGATYFGPFRGPQRVRGVVRQVVDLLRLRDCAAGTALRFADQLDFFGRDDTPLCLRADLGRCLAPCAGRCTRAEYAAQVELGRRFLEGDLNVPLAILHARMDAAATRLQFEYAAQLRDRAAALESARAELVELRKSIESLSFVYDVPGIDGDDRRYVIRRGGILAELSVRTDDERMQAERTAQHILSRPENAFGSVRPDHAAEALLLARWFRLRPEELENTWGGDARKAAEGARLLSAIT